MVGIAGAIPDKLTSVSIVLQSQTLLTISWPAQTLAQSHGLAITNYLIKSDDADFILGEAVENGQATSYSKIVA